MANEKNPPLVPDDIGRRILEPINHGFAAASRKALDVGVPAHQLLELHINCLASVLAMLEPAEARAGAIQDTLAAIPRLVRQHVDQRLTTPGGIRLPRAPA